MALTGQQLLEGFSRFIGDWWSSTATSTSGDATTLIDTKLGRWGDDAVRDFYLRPTQSGDNQYDVRRITDFVSGTGTCTVSPDFDAAITAADTYEMHRYDPDDKFNALDLARFAAFDDVYQLIRDDTVTADGANLEFPIPSSIRFGPEVAIVESPLPANAAWNLLANADGTTVTGWNSANGVAASVVSRSNFDPLVPKLGAGSVVKLVYTDGGTDGTFNQVVADMKTGVTAATVAGRRVELGMWVYSRTAGPLLDLIGDGPATLDSSSAHQGLGWEFLTVTANFLVTNATTFTVQLRFPQTGSADRLVYVQRMYAAFDQLPEMYHMENAMRVERDDTTKQFHLRERPVAGLNIRLVGRDHLSALGTTRSTQVTNTMEVDEAAAQILYADAARILFGNEMLNSPSMNNVARRIGWVEANRTKLARQWRMSEKDLRMVPPFNAS